MTALLGVDCSTGETVVVSLDKDEAQALAQAMEQAKQTAAAKQTAHNERLDAIRAKAQDDPAYKALAEHLGINLEETA